MILVPLEVRLGIATFGIQLVGYVPALHDRTISGGVPVGRTFGRSRHSEVADPVNISHVCRPHATVPGRFARRILCDNLLLSERKCENRTEQFSDHVATLAKSEEIV